MKKCRCFSPPPGSPFVAGEKYNWDYCLDGKIIYHESGVEWAEGEFDFYKYFSPIIEAEAAIAGE